MTLELLVQYIWKVGLIFIILATMVKFIFFND